MRVDPDELVEHWTLLDDERELIAGKRGPTRLGFAVLLKFYARAGRFPRGRAELDDEAVAFVARQVGVPASDLGFYEWTGSTIEYHRAQIRHHLEFRECTADDAVKLTGWLADGVCQAERGADRVREPLLARCRAERIEPPSAGRCDRIVRSALYQAEQALTLCVSARLGPQASGRLAELAAAADDDDTAGGEPSALSLIKSVLISTVHRIGARAERKVTQELVSEFRKVAGKETLLFRLAEAAIARPDDTVRAVVYPVAGEKMLRDLVAEYKSSGPAYRRTVQSTLRASYTGHYRRGLVKLLEVLEFSASSSACQPVIEALALIRRRIRIADVDLDTCRIRITQSKGGKDRVVPFPPHSRRLSPCTSTPSAGPARCSCSSRAGRSPTATAASARSSPGTPKPRASPPRSALTHSAISCSPG